MATMRNLKPFVGIDLGGTNMQIGVVSHDAKLLAPAKRKTKADEGFDAIIDRMIDGINEACERAGIAVGTLGGIGIGAPGAVDPTKGVVIEAVNLRWNDVALADVLTKRLKVKAFLDNDVNVAVYGEWRLGAGRNCENLLGVWCGTGIGGGLVLNGKLHYGDFLTAGEIGHTIAIPHMPRGVRSLENNCSRSAVVDRLVRLLKSNAKSKISAEVGTDYDKIKSKTLAKYYRGAEKEDKVICEVVDQTADLLAISIANVATLLSLKRVVLGGGLTEALGKAFVARVEEKTKELVFPPLIGRDLKIVASELEDNAGVLGAAMIAMDRVNSR